MVWWIENKDRFGWDRVIVVLDNWQSHTAGSVEYCSSQQTISFFACPIQPIACTHGEGLSDAEDEGLKTWKWLALKATKCAGVILAAHGAETDEEGRSAKLFLIPLFINPRAFGPSQIMSQYWKLVLNRSLAMFPILPKFSEI